MTKIKEKLKTLNWLCEKRVFIGCTNVCINYNYAVSCELAGAHGLQFVKVLLNLTLENSSSCMGR